MIGGHQFIHDVLEPGITLTEGLHTFSGHVHPAVSLRGKGKQALRFPCFYFTDNYCILPAFSRFTGSYTVEPGKNDHAYALVEKDIILLGKNDLLFGSFQLIIIQEVNKPYSQFGTMREIESFTKV